MLMERGIQIVALLCVCSWASGNTILDASDDCASREFPLEPFKFQFRISGNRWFDKDCPPLHIYSKDQCGCIKADEAETLPKSSTQPPPTTTPSPLDSTTQTAVTMTTNDTLIVIRNCSLKENPLDRHTYIQETNDGGVIMPCSNGTIFQSNPACACIHWDLVGPSCPPDVNLTTDEGKVVGRGGTAGYILPVAVADVYPNGKELNFTGNSEIVIHTFNGVEFNNGFTITFEFLEMSPLLDREILITNCDKVKQGHSLEIALAGKYVEFTIDVGKSKYFQTNVEFTKGPSFKRVEARYDGDILLAFVDNKMGTIPEQGVIQKRERPILIGNTECPGSYGFNGIIRNLVIYRCVKTDETP